MFLVTTDPAEGVHAAVVRLLREGREVSQGYNLKEVRRSKKVLRGESLRHKTSFQGHLLHCPPLRV